MKLSPAVLAALRKALIAALIAGVSVFIKEYPEEKDRREGLFRR